MNGAQNSSGRLEVWLAKHWGPVCGEFWDKKNGKVVCRQLGFGSPFETKGLQSKESSSSTERFGAHNITFSCSGNEHRLSECKREAVTGAGSCNSTQHVFLNCSEAAEVSGQCCCTLLACLFMAASTLPCLFTPSLLQNVFIFRSNPQKRVLQEMETCLAREVHKTCRLCWAP